MNRLLHSRDLHVTRWSQTSRALRPRLLAQLGVTEFVDVGANEGQYARGLRENGYRGRIVSLEPVAAAFAKLERAAAGDPAWTCICAAAGAAPGEGEINVARASVFSSILTMDARTERTNPRAATTGTERVALVTVDDVVARECGEGPLALKVDVQGYEAQVLDGAARALERAASIELELSPVPVYEGEPPMVEMLTRLEEAGFALALTENVWLDERAARFRQFDCLFVRRT